MFWGRVVNFVTPVGILVLALAFACSSAKDSARFAANAAQGGMTEVELGKLAIQRGTEPSVKEFGQRMIADHTRANNELKLVAAEKNIELPSDLNSSQKSTMEKLLIQGIVPRPMTLAELRSFVRSESEKFGRVAEAAKIRAE